MARLEICDDLAATAGPIVTAAIESVLERRGHCRLGLSASGGSIPLYRWLAEHLPSEVAAELRVTWVDEVRLPLDHPSSGYALAKRHWFDRASTPPGAILPMARGSDEDLQNFQQAFRMLFLGAIDVVLLGGHPDGQLAGLFPGHLALEDEAMCLCIDDAPQPPSQRLLLTMPTLQRVELALVTAEGLACAESLHRAWEGDRALPLGRYTPLGDFVWVLDPMAASQLGEDPLSPRSP